MTAKRSKRSQLLWLMVRGEWRRTWTALVAAGGATTYLAFRKSEPVPAPATAAATVASLSAVLAALAVKRSAESVRNPPTRNETPQRDVAPDLGGAVRSGFRNPAAASLKEADRVLPAAYAGCDVDSTDGSFDRRLAEGGVRAIGAVDAERGELPPAMPLERTQLAASIDGLEGAVWLMPSARYHLQELGPLSRELTRAGVRWAFGMVSAPGEGLLNELSKWAPEYYLLGDPKQVRELRPRCLVLMSDWGLQAQWVSAAQEMGIATFAKVEGAQDFANRDTLRRVLPYTLADRILCQGPYDLEQRGDRGVVVGSCRIEGLLALRRIGLRESPVPGYVTANYNFSYGTREYASKRWLRAVSDSAKAADRRLAVSLHPAVSRPNAVEICRYPLAFELERCSAFVTRASTALFDAAALGTPVAYFNPHRERCWLDLAFDVDVPKIGRQGALSTWLRSETDENAGQRWLLKNFLSVESTSSASRMAKVILADA